MFIIFYFYFIFILFLFYSILFPFILLCMFTNFFKVHLELLGEYYSSKYGVDFRSLRYTGVISEVRRSLFVFFFFFFFLSFFLFFFFLLFYLLILSLLSNLYLMETPPGGGARTTRLRCFIMLFTTNRTSVLLKEDSRLPMFYMPDTISVCCRAQKVSSTRNRGSERERRRKKDN